MTKVDTRKDAVDMMCEVLSHMDDWAADDARKMITALLAERDELRQALEQARDALQWYADKVNECNRHGSNGDAARDALAKDTGDRARAALKSKEEE